MAMRREYLTQVTYATRSVGQIVLSDCLDNLFTFYSSNAHIQIPAVGVQIPTK